MEEVSVQVEKVQAPIPKPDLSFGCRYRNQVSVVHYTKILESFHQKKLKCGNQDFFLTFTDILEKYEKPIWRTKLCANATHDVSVCVLPIIHELIPGDDCSAIDSGIWGFRKGGKPDYCLSEFSYYYEHPWIKKAIYGADLQ